MMPAVVVWAIVATVLAIVGLVLARQQARERRREVEAVSTTLDRHNRWAEREINYWRVEVDAERERARAMMHVANERHAAEIERLTNLLTVGTPARPEAVVTAPEPDAESRLIKAISEDSIRAGIIRLKQEYAQLGIVVADEEVRDEVIAMLMGNRIPENPDRILKVAD